MKNENQLFSMIEPSGNLKISIMEKIRKEEIKKATYEVVLSSAASLVSISAAIFFVISIVRDAYQSGLSEYLSLIFSDGASLISYWQSYIMSIIESLPILQITIFFASIWVFAWSLNKAMTIFKNTRAIFYKVN